MTAGKRLEEWLLYLKAHKGEDWSQKKLSIAAKVTQSTVSLIINDRSKPDIDTLAKISQALGITLEQFWGGPPVVSANPAHMKLAAPPAAVSSENGYVDVPYLDARRHAMNGDNVWVPHYCVRAGAGNGVIASDPDVKEVLPFREGWVRRELGCNPANLVMVDAYGESMEPTISDGDTLLVDRSRRDLKQDGVYVLRFGDELFVKRTQYQMGRVLIISDNAKYESYYFDESAGKCFGRVVWKAGKMR